MAKVFPVQIVTRISEPMRRALAAEAERQERTEAQIVRLALRDYLDNRDLAA